MSKAPSTETQLKRLRAEHNAVTRELIATQNALKDARERIQSLIVQTQIWERRHDALIAAIGRNKP